MSRIIGDFNDYFGHYSFLNISFTHFLSDLGRYKSLVCSFSMARVTMTDCWKPQGLPAPIRKPKR